MAFCVSWDNNESWFDSCHLISSLESALLLDSVQVTVVVGAGIFTSGTLDCLCPVGVCAD